MDGQTARIAARCECGAMGVRQVNQFLLRDRLWSDAEFCCAACGTYRCEHSGEGPAPEDTVSLSQARELTAELGRDGRTGTRTELAYLQLRPRQRGVPTELSPLTLP
ncbi:hypothetical protein [Kitasatospora sp. P5_F3]